MARGTTKSAEERIQELEEKKAGFQQKIDSYKDKISEVDKQIKSIREEIDHEQLEEVVAAIKKSGKTVEEFLAEFSHN